MVKAVSLFSGSLASLVATALIAREPEVEEVKLLHFRSPFFREFERTKELGRQHFNGSFRSQSVKRDILELHPLASGDYSPPACCWGCRRLLLHKALRYMKRVGADFLITGERVGARGLGRTEMVRIAEEAGVGERVLRPLSAKLLPPTLPERRGWVDRERLLDLTHGDDERLRQVAQELGIRAEGFPAAQRCKLLLPHFGRRLAELRREGDLTLTLNGLELLEFPLYYRRPPDVKIVLGRSDEEKRRLQTFFLPDDLRLYIPSGRGPMALVRANWREKSEAEVRQIVELAARLAAMHADVGKGHKVQANYRFESSQETRCIQIVPFSSERELERHGIRLGF